MTDKNSTNYYSKKTRNALHSKIKAWLFYFSNYWQTRKGGRQQPFQSIIMVVVALEK